MLFMLGNNMGWVIIWVWEINYSFVCDKDDKWFLNVCIKNWESNLWFWVIKLIDFCVRKILWYGK